MLSQESLRSEIYKQKLVKPVVLLCKIVHSKDQTTSQIHEDFYIFLTKILECKNSFINCILCNSL